MHDVVVHHANGTILKGTTGNFRPNAPTFHLQPSDGGAAIEVSVAELKGLFFVHDLDGNPEDRHRDDAERAGLGRKVEVTFSDGEILDGYTTGYSPNRPTFWVTPADPNSNNDRILVVASATASVRFV